MSFKKIAQLASSAVLSLSSLLVIAVPAAHAAGTVTWTGTDCATNCNWSNTNNWSGGVAPTTGDDVVIDTSVNQASGISTNDIPSLAINTLTFTNNAPSPNYTLSLGSGLTVNSAITQAASSTTTIPILEGSLVLGGDVLVKANYIMNFVDTTPSTSSSINLNGFALTFSDTGNTTGAPIVSVATPIIGTGSVVFDAPQTDFQMNGGNTYSGTTHIISTALPVRAVFGASGLGVFGSSSVTIESGGSASFKNDSSGSVNNAIIIAGTTSGSPVTSLSFGCLTTCTSATISVPNITLNGDTRFANSSDGVVVDLAGITANSHCIEYLQPSLGSNSFQNGPAACVVDGGGAATDGGGTPGTPDTGLAAIVAHPVQTLLITSVLAAALLAIALRVKPAKQSK